TEESPERQQPEEPNVSLTRGQVNAVRAASKAGITPSRIASQFAISQSDVRKVGASESLRAGKGRQYHSRRQRGFKMNAARGARSRSAIGNICGRTCSFSPHAFPYESIRALIACSHRYVPYPTE